MELKRATHISKLVDEKKEMEEILRDLNNFDKVDCIELEGGDKRNGCNLRVRSLHPRIIETVSTMFRTQCKTRVKEITEELKGL